MQALCGCFEGDRRQGLESLGVDSLPRSSWVFTKVFYGLFYLLFRKSGQLFRHTPTSCLHAWHIRATLRPACFQLPITRVVPRVWFSAGFLCPFVPLENLSWIEISGCSCSSEAPDDAIVTPQGAGVKQGLQWRRGYQSCEIRVVLVPQLHPLSGPVAWANSGHTVHCRQDMQRICLILTVGT